MSLWNNPYTGECQRPTTTTTTRLAVYETTTPKMVKLVYDTYVPENLSNHPELLSINHQGQKKSNVAVFCGRALKTETYFDRN